MKSQLLTVLAFVALLLGVSTACNRNPIDINALEKDLVGLWWDEYEYADVTEAKAVLPLPGYYQFMDHCFTPHYLLDIIAEHGQRA